MCDVPPARNQGLYRTEESVAGRPEHRHELKCFLAAIGVGCRGDDLVVVVPCQIALPLNPYLIVVRQLGICGGDEDEAAFCGASDDRVCGCGRDAGGCCE